MRTWTSRRRVGAVLLSLLLLVPPVEERDRPPAPARSDAATEGEEARRPFGVAWRVEVARPEGLVRLVEAVSPFRGVSSIARIVPGRWRVTVRIEIPRAGEPRSKPLPPPGGPG
jgi:hypothetical protein